MKTQTKYAALCGSDPKYRTKVLASKRRYYLKNKEKIDLKKKSVRARYLRLMNKCKKLGLDSNLTTDDFKILISQPCFYCLDDLSNSYGVSLDRKDNSKGYLRNNVLPCCRDCNVLRKDLLSVEECLKVIMLLQEERDTLFVWRSGKRF